MSIFDELNSEGNAIFNQLQTVSGTTFSSGFQDSPFGVLETTNLEIDFLDAKLSVVLKDTAANFKVRLPDNANKATLFVLKNSINPIIDKTVTSLPKSGITHKDFKKYLGIGLGENVYKLAKTQKGKENLIEQFLEWFGLDYRTGYNEASELNKVITEFVAKNPTYKANKTVPKHFITFLEMVELGVLDISNTAKFLADEVFNALATEVRELKLKEEHWNPSSKDENKKNNYDPLIKTPSQIKSEILNYLGEFESKSTTSLVTKIAGGSNYNDLKSTPVENQIEALQKTSEDWITILKNFFKAIFDKLIGAFANVTDEYIKVYNAFIVGVINGVIELVAGILESIGTLLGLMNYENFEAFKEGIAKFIKEADFDSVVTLLKDELFKLFSFLDSDSIYKNAKEFGELLPKLLELALDVFFGVKGAISVGRKAIDILKDLPKAIKGFSKNIKEISEKLALLAIDKKFLEELNQAGFDIKVEFDIDPDALGNALGVKKANIVPSDDLASKIIVKGFYLEYKNVRLGKGKSGSEIKQLYEKLNGDKEALIKAYAREKTKVLNRSKNFKKHSEAIDQARKPYKEAPKKIESDWNTNKKIIKKELSKSRAQELHKKYRKAELNTEFANIATGKIKMINNKTGDVLYEKNDYLLASGKNAKLPPDKDFPDGSIDKPTITKVEDKAEFKDPIEGKGRFNDSEHPMLRIIEEDSILVLDKNKLDFDDVTIQIEIESTYIPCQVCKREILLRQKNLGKNASIEVRYPTLKNGDPVRKNSEFEIYLNE